MSDRICSIDGCLNPCKANRPLYCSMHAERIRRHGDPHHCGKGGRPRTTGPTTYNSAHRNLFRLRGSARSQVCVDCGGPAREWSLIRGRGTHVGVNAGYPMTYSPDPMDYEPRCRSCHVAYDAA